LLEPGILKAASTLPAMPGFRTGGLIPCSDGCLRVCIAGIRIDIQSSDLGPRLGRPAALEPFLLSSNGADVRLTAAWGETRRPIKGDKLFDSGPQWQLYWHEGGYVFRCTSPVRGPEPFKEARFSPDFTSGSLNFYQPAYADEPLVYPLEYPLGELLMVNLLALRRGVELHGCGVADSDGSGYLFLGHSGAGKTTMAGPWADQEGVTVLSDDRIVVRALEDHIWMFGTPWHGEGGMARPERAPLRRVFFLERGAANAVRPLSPARAVAQLMACGFVPFHSASGMDFTLGLLQQVAEAVPCAALQFIPGERVIEYIRSLLL
jgi:hypothetical protein